MTSWSIDFRASPAPTLGVEWEFALVDRPPATSSTRPPTCSPAAHDTLPDPARLHKELLRNTVEVVTGVCDNVAEAMADLRGTLEAVIPAADELGVDLFGAGTHPFARGPASSSPRGTATRS